MARTVTLADLRTRARQRADMVGSNFVSDSELNGYINSSIADLYDLLVKAYGEDYYLSTTPYSFTTVSGTDMYELPEAFYKLAGVDVQIHGSEWYPIAKYNFNERNRGQTGDERVTVQYRLHGTMIRFTPPPSGEHGVRIWYVPSAETLENDEDTFDGINGWEEFVVIDAAIKCLLKEESDVTDLLGERTKIETRIEAMKENRDVAEPERITDIYAPDYQYEDIQPLRSW